MFADEVSQGFRLCFPGHTQVLIFIIAKWSVLAPGHGEQIRGTGRYNTEKEAALKNAVCTSSLNSPAVGE